MHIPPVLLKNHVGSQSYSVNVCGVQVWAGGRGDLWQPPFRVGDAC